MLVGVFDEDEVKGRRVADKLETNYYSNLGELLSASNLDIGVVTAENARKRDFAISLARAKKHVICDKPLGVSAKEARDVIEECQKSDVRLQVGYVSRYTSEAQFAKSFVSKGKVGKIKFINAENRVDMGVVKMLSPWLLKRDLAGGGALLEHSVHAIDLALWFNEDDQPVSAYAVKALNLDQGCEGEDNFVVAIMFDNGSIATVDGSDLQGELRRSSDIVMRIAGGKGEIDLYSLNLELREYSGEEPNTRLESYSRHIGSSGEADSAVLMVKDMLNSVKTGKEPLTNGRAAEMVNRVVDASYKSLRSGGKELLV